MTITPHEIEVLKMFTGDREPEWGAWVGACLESLKGAGLVSGGPNYQITEAGVRFLASENAKVVS